MLDTRTNGYVSMLAKNCRKTLGELFKSAPPIEGQFFFFLFYFFYFTRLTPVTAWEQFLISPVWLICKEQKLVSFLVLNSNYSDTNPPRVQLLGELSSAQESTYAPSHRLHMCWWNEPAYYKSTERRRHPGDEGSAHWRKVKRNLIKISLMWSRKRLEQLWVCPSLSADVSRTTTMRHAHMYKMRFIYSKAHIKKKANLRKEAKYAFFSIHCDNGVKDPTDRRKRVNF